jgi:hypothetical protein
MHYCHWDLGRVKGVCGAAGGGVMRDRLLGILSALVPVGNRTKDGRELQLDQLLQAVAWQFGN